jgi:hypothetical protein
MDEHLAVLLRQAAAQRTHATDDDPYVWWGRVHSINRRSDLPHLESIRAIESSLDAEDAPETHLYLTDYRSLYVAQLAEIHRGPLRQSETDHVPAYYATDRLACDFWFKLWDIRRLVVDDLPETIEQLKKLRNVHYHDQPVSLYGGMVNLPLVVTRPDALTFFEPDERDLATDDDLWAQFDASIGAQVASVERSLRFDLLGEMAWNAFDPTVRSFIATAEKIYRDHRSDLAFDFSSVLGSFSKALEVHVGGLLRAACAKMPPLIRRMNVDGKSVDLAQERALSLQSLIHALGRDEERRKVLVDSLVNGQWLTGPFVAVLGQFREVRNAGIHEKRIDESTARQWRNSLLGVGTEGHLVQLAKVKPR